MWRKPHITVATGIGLALLAVGWTAKTAHAQTPVGNGCVFYDGFSCEVACTDIAFEVDCDAEVAVACEGQCTADAELDCTASCQASCVKECTIDPGKFTCEGYCEAGCNAECEAYCESEVDSATCLVDCQGFCAADCSGYCEATPPEVDCELACQGSCDASCRAEASVECNATCAADARLDCEAEVTGDCSADCLREGGVLVCDGIVETYGDYDTLVSEGYIEVEVDVGGSISCATAPVGRPGSGAEGPLALLILLGLIGWIATRRRRTA